MEQEMKFCQSCGMPLNAENLGTNANGSKNEDYCIYCYKDGKFLQDCTMDEMIEHCAQFVDEVNKGLPRPITTHAVNSPLFGIGRPRSSCSSEKMFLSEGGGSTPFCTEKQSPCACPGPWYGSCPRITTLVASKLVYFSALKMSYMLG